MKKVKDWIPSIIVMGVIFGLSSVPGPTVDAVGLNKNSFQISAHFILFMILTLTYFKPTKNIIVSILLTILFAFTDEFHQMFTYMRSSSIFDVCVDSLGSLLSGVLIWKLQPLLPKKLRSWLKN